jgi:glycosyltransferase involved in cell wall biosynthesis
MQRQFPTVRPKVVGNVVRTDFFTLHVRARSEPFRFAALALMNPGKGIDVLLQAARKLIDRGCARFRLTIGGDGPERRALERMAQDLALQGNVHFSGLLSRPQVRTLLQEADIFVLPSLGETFGVAVGEAMACGTPVIATRSGGPEFVLGPGDGILVPANDAEALAGAMRQAYEGTLECSPAAVRESVERRLGPFAFRKALLEIYGAVGVRAAPEPLS